MAPTIPFYGATRAKATFFFSTLDVRRILGLKWQEQRKSHQH